MQKLLFALLISIFAVYLSRADVPGCVGRACTREYNPVCGMRYVDGNMEKKIFGNPCMMEAANDCGGGYSLCEEY